MVETAGNAPAIGLLLAACKAGALLVEPRPQNGARSECLTLRLLFCGQRGSMAPSTRELCMTAWNRTT
jgi:hypothetical protein